MEKEKPGQAVCPYDPHHNSSAIYVGKCSSLLGFRFNLFVFAREDVFQTMREI